MNTLLGDLWFYAGSAGLVFSAGLWLYLFRRYRAAPAAELDLEPHSEAVPPPEPVMIAAAIRPAARLMPVEQPEIPRAPKTATPAVVYLQNLKIQMEHFEKEIHELRSQLAESSQKHDSQFNALLQRLGDLNKQVLSHEQAQKDSAIERIPSLKEDTAPIREAPQQEPKKEPVLKLNIPEEPKAKPPAEQAQQEEGSKPKRKGPVWPV